MNSTKQLIEKYNHYSRIGHCVFAVTLSTYVKSVPLSRSDLMRKFWDHHFIFRVKKCLPYKAKIDHDWVLEESPDGYFHYHGLLAVESMYRHRIWSDDRLSKKLSKALDSFSVRGKYRPFRVNKYLVEPTNDIAAWATYITKQSPVYLNTNVLPWQNG